MIVCGACLWSPGAYVSTAQSTEWTLASLYVANIDDLVVDWYCAQACSGQESAAEASGQWLPGAVTPEEQCWASSGTTCSVRLESLCVHFAHLHHDLCVRGGSRKLLRGRRRGATKVPHRRTLPVAVASQSGTRARNDNNGSLVRSIKVLVLATSPLISVALQPTFPCLE